MSLELLWREVGIADGELQSLKFGDDLFAKFAVTLRHATFAASEHDDDGKLLEVLNEGDDA